MHDSDATYKKADLTVVVARTRGRAQLEARARALAETQEELEEVRRGNRRAQEEAQKAHLECEQVRCVWTESAVLNHARLTFT